MKSKGVATKFLGLIVGIVIVLLFISVAIPFMFKLVPYAGAKPTASLCKNSLDVYARAQGIIDGTFDKIPELPEGWEIYTKSYEAGWKAGKASAGIVGAVVGGTLGGLGALAAMAVNWAFGGATNKINKAVDKMEDIAKAIIPTFCVETPVPLKGDAVFVAKSLYRLASTTFYSLRGYLNYSKKDINLFKVNVVVTGPGNLTLQGKCSNYIKEKYIGKGMAGALAWKEVEGENISCIITIDTIDEAIMTLAMIEECQRYGPLSKKCKCFVKPVYSVDNGYANPYVIISPASKALEKELFQYIRYWGYPGFEGCGAFYPQELLDKYTIYPLTQQTLDTFNIKCYFQPISIGATDRYLYIRLNEVERLEISEDRKFAKKIF